MEQDAVSQPAEPETNSEEQSTLPVKTEEGTILLTPEEIRAALDAGTLDASNIDTACLTDENGLLSWLWNLLFGKETMTAAPRLRSIPAGAPWAARPTIMTSTPTSRSRASSPSTTSSITSTPTVSSRTPPSASMSPNISRTSTGSRVKTAGVKFVIIRIGYRGYGSGAQVLDAMFEQHFTNARNAGLKVGVYFFSQAVNENEAREEAQGCAYVLNGRKLDYPIYFDTEASGGKNGRADGLGVEDRTKCAIAFCEEVKAQGYQAGRLRLHPVVPQAHRPEPAEELQHLERPL
ncbi:MAG: GH25 family lysozyme [Faecalibacterium prausnitzii]